MRGAQAPAHWASDSEVGRLRDVLLCRPDYFRWLPTSAISRATLESGQRFDQAVASAQHTQLVDALEGSGVQCHYIDPDPALPYQVFTRDSSVMTPAGMVVTQPSQEWRRGEAEAVSRFASAHDIPVAQRITTGTLEGGDVILVAPGRALIGAGEARTTYDAAQQLAQKLRDLDWDVRVEPFPARYVHMDVLVCMVAEALALVCEDVVSGGLFRWLRQAGVKTISVTREEAMGLGVNVLSLGEDRVISGSAAARVNGELRAYGLTVIDPDLCAFTLGGGGPHCLTQALRRDS